MHAEETNQEKKNVIEFHNVSKRYKQLKALDNVNFEIQDGDTFGYIGPNGAGKTTTIKILVGLIKNYSGQVLINGKDIAGSEVKQHIMMGYHPQEVGFQRWKTVKQVLYTFGLLSGIKKDLLMTKIEKVLKFVNLHEAKDRKVIHLSGGMIQRLRLAQALLDDPQILVLDEPLNGLDPASRYQVKNLIHLLHKEGKTILFSSHILSDVQDVATKIGILHNGKVIKVGTPDGLQNEFNIGNLIELEYASNKDVFSDFSIFDFVESTEYNSPTKLIIHLKPQIDVDICIERILKELVTHKTKIRGFNLLKPSLEDVYLKYIQEVP
jgi:ABC-2 type transport system ATP-binding protein